MSREKSPPESAYRPLWHSELDVTEEGDALITGQRKLWEDKKKWWSPRRTIYALSLGLFVLFMSNIAFVIQIRRMRTECFPSPQLIFSPATDAIDYEVVKFHVGPLNNEEDDLYSLPPSPEVDQAWRDLYEVGAVSLPFDMADKLANKTLPLTDGSGLVMGIDVFHQLHCLNKIRKALHPDYYGLTEDPYVTGIHITHCVNSLRQSLMCASDISTIPFNVQSIMIKGHPTEPKRLPSFDVQHSCRNFKKIQEWTRARWTNENLDEE